MKRCISLICSILLFFGCFVIVPRVNAAQYERSGELILVSETVEYLEDGSSIITSVYEEVVMTRSNLYDKTGSKVYRFRNADGEVLWALTVHGEFQVIEGASVTCTSASCSTSIYNDAWSCTRKSAAPSGSQAVATGQFQKTLLGIVVDTENVNVTLSCDPYGNLY